MVPIIRDLKQALTSRSCSLDGVQIAFRLAEVSRRGGREHVAPLPSQRIAGDAPQSRVSHAALI
jgi:hypothetical protein